MTLFKRAFGLLVVLGVSLAAWGLNQAAPLKPLTEADVLNLVQLQIDDEAIIARLEKAWVSFKVDDAVVQQLKAAGASEAILARLRAGPQPDLTEKPLPDDPRKGSLMVWVTRKYSSDCPLHSEFRINGKLVNVFSSDSQQAIGSHVKMGWNVITLKTSVKSPEKEWNELRFQIGPTHRDPKTDKLVMAPVLWEFDNGSDWNVREGMLRHRLGPDVKEVTLSLRLFFAGLQHEAGKVKNGDYVLKATQKYSPNPVAAATVLLNGTPLNTFVGGGRQSVIITDLVKKGKNEFKLITNRLGNTVEWNDIAFELAGPAVYSIKQETWLLEPVVDFKSMAGWVQNDKTARWFVEGKPDADSLERVIPFFLNEAPKTK